MIFRILGPLEAAGTARLGGLKQRGLLAILILRANEAVGRDELIDELWDARPPETAAHAIQVYVSRLRKLLAVTQAEIAHESGGYRLVVDPREVDAQVFERLLDEGRRMLAVGNAAGAADQLTQALALWRGGALFDFQHEDFAQAEIARLEELRLSALEERFEARLATGADAELVPELERLVAEQPLRERVQGQLMLALYRSGRQADALAAYRRAARMLREQLGLDPGPVLRELEAAILRQTPALVSDPAPRRLRLPVALTPLVGRSAEADEVAELLRGPARLVTLVGAGGIGKTRLAVEAASRLAPDFPDGVTFAGLGSVIDEDLVLPTVARALDAPEADGDPVEALAEHIGDNRLLIVVDNVEHVLGAAPALSALLARCRGLRLLATSRTALRLYGEHRYDVPPLDAGAAVALFLARARAQRSAFGVEPGSEAVVEQICARLDRMPLAIELTAARSRTLAPQEMLTTLPRALDLAADGPRDAPDRQRTLRATMRWSWKLLPAREAVAFRRLGVFAGGWTCEAAAAVAGTRTEEIESLAQQSLVVGGSSSRRHGMLATIREYAVELLEAGGEAQALRRRHAEHFLTVAEAGDVRLRTGDQAATLDELEAEHDNLRAALTWAAEHDPALRLSIAAALGSFWAVRGHVVEGRRQLEEAIAAPAADERTLAKALAGAGILARCQTDHDAARTLLDRSARLCRASGDRPGLVRALANLGFVEAVAGDAAQARACYEEALEAARRSCSLRDRYTALNCLADLALHEETFPEVQRLSAEALALAREARDREASCVALLNGAQAAFRLGHGAEALFGAVAALELWASLGDEGSVSWCLDLIALIVVDDDPALAARLLATAAALRTAAGVALDGYERWVRERAEHALGRSGSAAVGELPLDEAIEQAREVAAAITGAARASR